MKELHAHGYFTGHIGKWHLGENSNHKTEGYDYWAGMEWLGKFFDTEISINGEEKKFNGFSDDIISDLAADFINEHANNEKPFALYVGLKSPHMPFGFPERLRPKYKDASFPKPSTFNEDYEVSGKTALIGNYIRFDTAPFGIKGWKTWRNYIRSYYRSATAVDDAVGTIMDALEKEGIKENTIVIYTSDQGYNNGEHGLTEKHFGYEPVMNVPMVLSYPGLVKEPKKIQDMVATIDIRPTILELCNIPLTEKIDGKSWLPLLREKDIKKPFREELLFAYNYQHPYGPYIPGQLVVRTDRYKLITYPDRKEIELYDLQVDPEESVNYSDSIQYQEVLADMKVRLEKLKKESDWSKRERKSIESVDIIGPVDSVDVEQLVSSVFSNNAQKKFIINDKQYQFQTFKGDHGNFNTSAINSVNSGYLLMKFEVENNRQEDLYSAFSIRPFKPITGYCNGELFVERNIERMGEYNFPAKEGDNTVIFCVKWDTADDLELIIDVPGDWMRIKN
jgi:arylsulfatase A-like enzyme